MEENVMNNVAEEIMENIDIPEVVQEQKGIGGIVLGLGAAALFGLGMFVHKNKVRIAEKRIDHQIEKLKKKGYLVYKEVEIDKDVVEEVKPIE